MFFLAVCFVGALFNEKLCAAVIACRTLARSL